MPHISEPKPLGFYALTPSQFETEVNAAIDNYKQVVKEVKARSTHNWAASIQPLEEAEENLERIWWLLEHENAVANTPAIRETYEKLLRLVHNLHTDTYQDADLQAIYKEIANSSEYATLSKAQQAIIDHVLRSFKLNGVDLPPEQRAQAKALSEKLAAAETKFTNNVLDATEDWSYHVTTAQKQLLDGLPEHLLEQGKANAASQDKTGWVFTLDQPTYYTIVTHAANRQLREEFYLAYYTRASDQGPMAGKWDNTPVMQEILALRQQYARLLGYANYAEYSLVPKMARSVAEVKQFLNDLVAKVRPQAQREFAKLQEFAKSQSFAQELEAWDVAYYAEQYRIQHYNISDEELRAYFPETRVLDGLFKLAEKIFGLKITEEKDFATWDPAVRMFKVIDDAQRLRGYFYVDLYTREGKRGGAWMAECVARMRLANGGLQYPVAYLNCNFSKPIDGKPGLLTHDEVVTLYHEFGHTIHHVLTQVDYFGAAGLNGVEWDAVELPSQFMENWAWQWEVIGESLPREIFDRLLASKNYNAALYLLRQLEYAIFDLRVHESLPEDQNRSAHDIMLDIRKTLGVVPCPEANRFENSFTHIFAGGYAAGYYSYLWAEVLSCDAFAKFTQEDLFSINIGKRFLTKILEKGGSEPAMDLFMDFAERAPSVNALLKHHAIS